MHDFSHLTADFRAKNKTKKHNSFLLQCDSVLRYELYPKGLEQTWNWMFLQDILGVKKKNQMCNRCRFQSVFTRLSVYLFGIKGGKVSAFPGVITLSKCERDVVMVPRAGAP